jgi:hypothetical protein
VWNGVEGVGIEVEFAVVVAVADRPCNGRSQHNMHLGSLTMCPDLFRSVAIVSALWSSVLSVSSHSPARSRRLHTCHASL